MNTTADTLNGLAGEIGKRRPFDSAEQEAFLNIARTREHLAADFAALFKTAGLSEPLYNVLRIVRGHGRAGVPSQQIGRHLVTRVPDVTRLIDRLVRAGWVKRHRGKDDRRVVRVFITPAGNALLRKLDKPVADLHRKQLGHLSARQLKTLNELLAAARQRAGD